MNQLRVQPRMMTHQTRKLNPISQTRSCDCKRDLSKSSRTLCNAQLASTSGHEWLTDSRIFRAMIQWFFFCSPIRQTARDPRWRRFLLHRLRWRIRSDGNWFGEHFRAIAADIESQRHGSATARRSRVSEKNCRHNSSGLADVF